VTRDFPSAEAHATPAPTKASVGAGDLAPAEVRAALDRIRKSETLASSEKLWRFLNFVVETTLRGHADYLKETIIGVAVFNRVPDYDPKADTIVRSQAWRLRSKLNEYYHSEGAEDPVIIDLPRGCYVPVFIRRSPEATKSPSLLSCQNP